MGFKPPTHMTQDSIACVVAWSIFCSSVASTPFLMSASSMVDFIEKMYSAGHFKELVQGAEGVRFFTRATPVDVVHVFCRRRKEVAPLVERALRSIVEGGMIWVSWPKKSSPLYRDLTEQDFRDHILPLGWVDVKVCAVDADWSGLKFLRRRA